jgi:DNA-binding response OmpR family regulator
MNIGIVEKDFADAQLLQRGLSGSGFETTIYHNARECVGAILRARFSGLALPHDALLVDLDLGDGLCGVELIWQLRQFVDAHELAFLVMNGGSATERRLLSQYLLDIPILYKETSPLIELLRKRAQ